MTKSNLACIQRVISKGPLFLKSFSMLQNNKIQFEHMQLRMFTLFLFGGN